MRRPERFAEALREEIAEVSFLAAALRAAAGLIEPTAYVHAVFPEAGG